MTNQAASRVLPINMGVRAAVETAHAMLGIAETNRRTPAPTFNTAPVPGMPVEADWAIAGLLVERAQHHLNESIPNGQTTRTQAALGALIVGTALLEAALADRGVTPLRVGLGIPPTPTPAADPAADPAAATGARTEESPAP